MVKPIKSLGQHFLVNEEIALRIVKSLQSDGQHTKVVEVGPGQGVLTKYLLQREELDLKVVELDRRMPEILVSSFPLLAGRIIQGDFLKMDLTDVHQGEMSLIGNFPYNISTQIVFKAIENRGVIKQVVGMFQKEVAHRICASHGSKKFGVTSVLTQLYYKAELLFDVGPEHFDPPPKVISSVLRLQRDKSRENVVEEKRMFRLVKLAFSQRRKKLKNVLKPLKLGQEVLDSGILDKRAEQLSVDDFLWLGLRVEW